jgi:hypothetical protein
MEIEGSLPYSQEPATGVHHWLQYYINMTVFIMTEFVPIQNHNAVFLLLACNNFKDLFFYCGR